VALDYHAVKFLIYCRKRGADFSAVATIGRQRLRVSTAELQEIFRSFGERISPEESDFLVREKDSFAERFLEHLGAREVHSFDYSSYEQATHTHDMNLPIADAYKCRYSLVLDGGSLEHIFNFPVAIRNCMEMVRAGGHFVALNPANNFLGAWLLSILSGPVLQGF
jgi:hypothetical protein